jgi:hypothetical protein
MIRVLVCIKYESACVLGQERNHHLSCCVYSAKKLVWVVAFVLLDDPPMLVVCSYVCVCLVMSSCFSRPILLLFSIPEIKIFNIFDKET